MAGADSQKLQDKLQEMLKLLTAGRGNREDTASVLTEAAERLNALEVSNRRLREEARGPAQIAWTKFMSGAIKGHLAHEMIALEFDESQWQSVLDNCEDIADAALIRWKMRWMDGISPVKRARKGHRDSGDSPPRAADGGAPPAEQPRAAAAAAHDLDHLFDPAPRGGPRMVDAVPPPKPAPAPAPEETRPAPPPPPAPVATPAAPAPKPEPPPPIRPEPPKAAPPPPAPPPPTPKERQPGDD